MGVLLATVLRMSVSVAIGASLFCADSSAAAAQSPGDELPQARTTEEVILRNLADPDGTETMRLPMGVPVRVHRTQGPWSLVEPPGGVTAWISGRYLRALELPGLYEVTRNAINLRPLPKSDLSSYPLPVRLQAGDQVFLVNRSDESKPLSEDWVRVRAPRGVPAWARTQDLALLESAVDEELWQTWVDRLAGAALSRQPGAGSGAGGQAGPGTTPEQASTPAELAQEALTAADALHEAGLELEHPDYDELRAAYGRVIELAPASDAAVRARDRIGLVDARAHAAEIEALLAEAQLRREQEYLSRQREIELRSREADPLGPRFSARGTLERRGRAGEPPTYVLRWGNEYIYELSCDSGRYDLEHFAGFLLGVSGESSEPTGPGELRLLDVDKIDVLGRR